MPFTHVLREIWPAVTRKGAEMFCKTTDPPTPKASVRRGCPDVTDKGKPEEHKQNEQKILN